MPPTDIGMSFDHRQPKTYPGEKIKEPFHFLYSSFISISHLFSSYSLIFDRIS